MLLDGYLLTLQLTKLMRLANILKNKLPFTYKNECDPVNTAKSTYCIYQPNYVCIMRRVLWQWPPQSGYRHKTVCCKYLPISSADVVMWDVRNLVSEQTCSSRRYFTHLKSDRMHLGWDQPSKQEQRDALHAFLGQVSKANKNVSKGKQKFLIGEIF